MSKELIILGKCVGKFNGWDEVETGTLQFYGFQANELGQQWLQYTIREKEANKTYTLCHSMETGNVQLMDDQGLYDERKDLDYSVFNKGDIS